MYDIESMFKHKMTGEWHGLLKKYAVMSNYKTALDIGTAMGVSAYTIAHAGKGTIDSVDVKRNRDPKRIAEQYEYADRVTFHVMTSSQFFTENPDKMYDFISVDGAHHFDEVLLDAHNAWKHLNSGGYIVFDDYNHWRLKEDVGRAVDDFAKDLNLKIVHELDKAIIFKP